MRSLAKNLLLSMAALVALSGALELGARLIARPDSPTNITPVPRELLRDSDVPGLRYELRPSSEVQHRLDGASSSGAGSGPTIHYRTNALGFRGPGATRAKAPGTFRIVGIGDSFTFGTGVSSEDTFLAELQRRLDEGAVPERCEVLNLGVPGYDTPEEVILLEHRGLALAPDLVVLGFFLNDTGSAGTHEAFNVSGRYALRVRWSLRSRLLDLLARRLERRAAIDSLVGAYRDAFRDDAPGWIHAREALAHAHRLTQERGVELVIVIFPVLWKLSRDYPFEQVHAAIAAFGARLGVPVLDLLPAFAGFEGPELWVHPTNQHPNARAHAIAGAALAAFLRERGLARCATRDSSATPST